MQNTTVIDKYIIMKQYYIYRTTNKINGKQYVGSHHGRIDDNYYGSGTLILKALKKYGNENFVKEILEIVADAVILKEREEYWLDKLQCATDLNYYNVTDIGGGGDLTKFKCLEEKTDIRQRQRNNREKKREEINKKIVDTRNNWSEDQKLRNKIRCSIASKKRYANMTDEQKVARIQKIKETKKNLPKEIQEATKKLRKEKIKEAWKKMTPEQITERSRKIYETALKNNSYVRSDEIKKKISKSVSLYYNNLPNDIKEKRALHISKKISTLKWCNDGRRNYRKTLEEIKVLNYNLGKLS